MKKSLFKPFALLASVFLAAVLASCKNYDDSVPVHTATLEVSVNTEHARSAIPVPPETVSFTVTATNGSATVSSSTPNESTGNYNLELPSENATWTLSVQGFSGTVEDNVQIYSGTGEVYVSNSGRYYQTVDVYYINDDEFNGSCELEIDVSGTAVSYVIVSGSGVGIDRSYDVKDGKISVSPGAVKTGNYSCTFQFFNESKVLLVALRDTINIRKNLITRSWYKNGSEPYLVTKDGSTSGEATFVLTNDIISQVANSTVYVSGGGSLSPSANPTGSWLAPYSSIQAAADRVIALNKINPSEYTIFVDGNLTGSNACLEISSELKLTVCGFGENPSILDAADHGSVMNISSASADVTVSNLKFSNASSENSEINLSAGTLQLSGNVSVSGQIYKSDSAEIYVKDDLSGSEGIGLMLESAAEGDTVLKASENMVFAKAVCNKFVVQNTETVSESVVYPYCLVPSNSNDSSSNDIAVLALEGASNDENSGITFDVKKYALSFSGFRNDENGNYFCSAGSVITISVCDSDNNAVVLESYACTLYLSQAGKEFLTASNNEKSSECSITVPSDLPAGDYSVCADVVIDGVQYSAQKDFTIE